MVGGQTQHLVSLVWPWITGPGVSPGLVKRMGGWERCYIEGGWWGGRHDTLCGRSTMQLRDQHATPRPSSTPRTLISHSYTLTAGKLGEKKRKKCSRHQKYLLM